MKNQTLKATVGITVMVIILIGVILFGWPQYRVWQQHMAGRARLAEAEYSRQIMYIEAQMNLQAEELNAQAEIARARGAAYAMEIVQEKLTDMYIRYLWVRQANLGGATIIYIPTEANLPILEAGRFNAMPPFFPGE